jgi:hypothetical protein
MLSRVRRLETPQAQLTSPPIIVLGECVMGMPLKELDVAVAHIGHQLQVGEISFETARQKAETLKKSNPDPVKPYETFDPKQEPYWTLPMALAWINSRDYDRVRWFWPNFLFWWDCNAYFTHEIYEMALNPEAKPTADILNKPDIMNRLKDPKAHGFSRDEFSHAYVALWNTFKAGELHVSAICDETGRYVDVPSLELIDLWLEAGPGLGTRLANRITYHEPLVRREDLLKCFPPQHDLRTDHQRCVKVLMDLMIDDFGRPEKPFMDNDAIVKHVRHELDDPDLSRRMIIERAKPEAVRKTGALDWLRGGPRNERKPQQ